MPGKWPPAAVPLDQSGCYMPEPARGRGCCGTHGLSCPETGGVAGGEQEPSPFISQVRTPVFAEHRSSHGTALGCPRLRCGCCPDFMHESTREAGTCLVTWPAGIEQRLTVGFPASGYLLEHPRKTRTGSCCVACPGPLG